MPGEAKHPRYTPERRAWLLSHLPEPPRPQWLTPRQWLVALTFATGTGTVADTARELGERRTRCAQVLLAVEKHLREFSRGEMTTTRIARITSARKPRRDIPVSVGALTLRTRQCGTCGSRLPVLATVEL